MNLTVLVPALTLLGVSATVGLRPLPLHPAWSARFLVVLALATAVAVVSTLAWVLSVAATWLMTPDLLAAVPAAGIVKAHGPVPLPLPVLAAVLLAVGVGRLAAAVPRWRREARVFPGTGTRVVEDDRPFAMAVPGRSGGVVVTSALLRLLSRPQLAVVFRHEHAHLRHRHHLLLRAVEVAASLVPPLALLREPLRFALERWADEAAAAAVGDRSLVAHTIARVALAAPPLSGPHLAMDGFRVVQRVEALLGHPPPDNPVVGPALVGGTGAATCGATMSSVHMHHILVLLLV